MISRRRILLGGAACALLLMGIVPLGSGIFHIYRQIEFGRTAEKARGAVVDFAVKTVVSGREVAVYPIVAFVNSSGDVVKCNTTANLKNGAPADILYSYTPQLECYVDTFSYRYGFSIFTVVLGLVFIGGAFILFAKYYRREAHDGA